MSIDQRQIRKWPGIIMKKYIKAKNKVRKTAIDLLCNPWNNYLDRCDQLAEIIQLIQQFEQFPTWRHIAATRLCETSLPYESLLPQSLKNLLIFTDFIILVTVMRMVNFISPVT